MQLSKIKIAGFKSFVDPTTIDLPSKMIAIVGPNGCGKSNIIDAVTWVMGESSPRYLRGEALTDVIFNGSSARKPIGQASVELIFDNSSGTMSGEYAKFAEVSVKRMINRDSDSSYYLNGVRCRKRDVVDIFLGTGLGPRSYSIIGQNMISRIIEAKPDELRIYLEEAAGISKYKERRHETELRVQHTKENITRINDVRVELEKQLNHLKHQANVAEKFKLLKQQERILRAEWLGIQWRDLDTCIVNHTLKIQYEETALESRNSELITVDYDTQQLRHEQGVAQDVFQEIQRRYYAVGNEITRIEQDILHHQERKTQWENDLSQTELDYQQVKNEMDEGEDQLHGLLNEIQQIEPNLSSIHSQTQVLQKETQCAEDNLQIWQNRWDEFNQLSAKTTQTAQVEKNHIQHLEQRIAFLQKRQEQLQQDQRQFDFAELTKEINKFSQKSDELTDKLACCAQELNDLRTEISTLQASQKDSHATLDKLRNESQRLCGQQASLEALQQTALGQRDNPATPWLVKHHLSTNSRLAQHLEVEQGWEFAVEKVLGSCLQAICTDQMDNIFTHLSDFKSGNICFISQSSLKNDSKELKANLLIQKIKSPWNLTSLVAGIYVAESLTEAIKLSATLADNDSIITKDGIWLNRFWLKVLREENPAAGIFQREQELKQLAIRIEQLQLTQKNMERTINERQENIHQLEQRRDQSQQIYSQQQAELAQINTQHKMKRERFSELKLQSERLTNEHTECIKQLKQLQEELKEARTVWEKAIKYLEQQTVEREKLVSERDKARLHVQNIRNSANGKKDEMHELEICLQKALSKKMSIQQNTIRLQTQLISLNERKKTLQNELSSMAPMESLTELLSKTLDKHVNIESELNTARAAIDSLNQEFRTLEEKRQIIEREIHKIRNMLESLRVDWQGWKVKLDTINEQINETEFSIEDILKNLPVEVAIEQYQVKLEQIVQRINRLGPINLVAIDEYTTCQERKHYLDKQIEDLQTGLNTLDEAIAKIDKETKSRFKETFDEINTHFQELFPTIFGGGKACLELTSDNLLEAGITLMATPPGKRNSSIYLLSGGEKSLTAIAFIFSIFHLNPAPFCLLDEVDAALDDTNVLRFTRLVHAMANKTQFIFISHNKTTIEMGRHLIGVTMNEPGVSRLVSVDIEKAMNMAGVK